MSAKFNLREQILATVDLKTSVVTIKEWGDLDITVRELNAGERDEIVTLHQSEDSVLHAVFRTITFGAIDEKGERIFGPEDAQKLAQKSDAPLTQLYQEIVKLSGLSASAPDDQGGEEETPAGKPSTQTQECGETTVLCTNLESEPTAN
ncbi:MAG: hypothetical protein RPR40_10105 [Bermanella sp.]|jgi:hypothetical protein